MYGEAYEQLGMWSAGGNTERDGTEVLKLRPSVSVSARCQIFSFNIARYYTLLQIQPGLLPYKKLDLTFHLI